MAGGYKRNPLEFDPNQSDPEDGDFNEQEANASGRSRKSKKTPKRKSKTQPKSTGRRQTKRQKTNDYGGSDVTDDDSDISSEESLSNSSEDEKPPATTSKGRAVRGAAAKSVIYTEKDSDDDEEEIQDTDPDDSVPEIKQDPAPNVKGAAASKVRKGSARPPSSLIIKLKVSKFPPETTSQRMTRARTNSRAEPRGMTPALEATGLGMRRSSRISHDDDVAELVALSDSGRHARVTRRGTATPEPRGAPHSRATRNNRGLKQLPSAIMEVSQEEIPASQDYPAETTEGRNDIISQLQEHAASGEHLKDEPTVAESPFAHDTQPDEDLQEDTLSKAPDDADADADAEADADADADSDADAGEDEIRREDDDDDDEPIKPRGGRSLRVRPLYS